VYIGGIMIFVLYAVLLTSELGGRMAGPSPLKILAATVVSVVAFGSIAGLALKAGTGSASARASAPEGVVAIEVSGDPDLARGVEAPARDARNIASMKALGERLLDPRGFLIPFELVSVLLLAAMVGAIAVARDSKAPAVAAKPAGGQGGQA
jgi:NADH-quinone oxidoreductase subunit J